MGYFKVGDRAKLNQDGRKVRIEQVRPVGLVVFYLVSFEDGHTAIVGHGNLRPSAKPHMTEREARQWARDLQRSLVERKEN